MDDPIINSACANLQAILQFSPEDKIVWMPAQYKVAVERLKLLFYQIAMLGGEALLQKYVESFSEIKTPEVIGFVYQCSLCVRRIKSEFCNTGVAMRFCPDLECRGEIQSMPVHTFRNVVHIRLFNTETFVPSYFELCDLEDTFYNSAAGAWDRICAVRRAWQKEKRDFFRRKKIKFDTPARAAKSISLLAINAYYLTIKKIKNSSEPILSIIQCDDLFKDVVRVVIERFGFNFHQNTLSEYIKGPEAIELKIEDNRLRLIVTWAAGLYGVYELQAFHDRPPLSCRGEFMRKLLDNPGMEIDCQEASGGNAEKYLKSAKIKDVLDQLFIDKKKGCSATLRSVRVTMEEQEDSVLQSLQNYLKTLKFVEWRKKI